VQPSHAPQAARIPHRAQTPSNADAFRLDGEQPQHGLERPSIELEIRDLTAATRSVTNGADYVGCFTPKQRPGLRRKAAMVFVMHDVDLELVDGHLVDEGERKAELAVMYRVTLSRQVYDVVSVTGLLREDEQWLIATEQVEARSGARHREWPLRRAPLIAALRRS
jgi:hypothetical protein